MNRKNIIAHAVVLIVGITIGLCVNWCDRKPVETIKVERDTVVVHDTIADVAPKAKDSVVVKYVTKFLPVAKTDTIHHFAEVSKMIHDTVAVEVPITSKHYGNDLYDAWVSGYEPSLDSIKVYQKEVLITETITRTIKDNKHFFLDVGAGCEYRFNDKVAVPFAELGLKFKTGRLGIGAYGGYSHDTNENKGLPNGRVKITYDIISF